MYDNISRNELETDTNCEKNITEDFNCKKGDHIKGNDSTVSKF